MALSQLPIANVSAILQALPLALTMGAALAFGQTVGWRRWIAIFAGFIGVVITVRPGYEGFSSYSLYALASVFCCTVRDLATSKLPDNIPTLLVSTVTSIVVTATGALLLTPMGGWTPIETRNLALMALGAMLLLLGYHFIIMAMRVGEVSFISPFRYTSLLSSILLGIIIFSELPDMLMILGATIIVASGLYTLYRERTVGRYETAAKSAGPSMGPDGI
jgi:drug/metabolite transporter (DMT)-like permease